jgi:hypothetical protein
MFPSRPKHLLALAPQFAWLSDDDKRAYICLCSTIANRQARGPRDRARPTFSDTLEDIKAFVMRNDNDDRIRALACGICWLPEGIAVNTHTLRQIIPHCKSAINNAFCKLGYDRCLDRAACAEALARFSPSLCGNGFDLRHWTVRFRSEPSEVFRISLGGIAQPQSPQLELATILNRHEPADVFPIPLIGIVQPVSRQREWAAVPKRQESPDLFPIPRIGITQPGPQFEFATVCDERGTEGTGFGGKPDADFFGSSLSAWGML